MPRRVSALVCALAMALAAAGCGKKDNAEPAVATPSLTLNRTQVPIGSPLKLTYKFVVAPGAKIDGDYWVFVHVLEPDGESLWGDDHMPPVPTSAWKPGQTVEYTRTIFVPNYPYIGPAVVRLGLYNSQTGDRLTLAATEASRKEYEVAKLELQPQSENIFLIYKDGWHPAEVASDDPNTEWQWTKKSATVSFRNPRKDGTVFLEYAARTDKFDPPQQVTLRSGDTTIGTFTADSRARKLVTIPFTAGQLGSSDVAELTIDVDRTFLPGGSDTRELGIQVFHLFVDAR